MKTLYYLSVPGLVFCVNIYANEAHSYFLSHSTNLVAQIKPNPIKGSEPAFNSVNIAAIHFIENDGGPRFGINFGCDKGYALIDGKCKPNVCEGYPYEDAISVANCETFEKCLSGSGYKYKCTSCKNGYFVSSGKCVANVCSGYNSTSSSISGCLSVTSCQKGDSMVYGCSQCYAGYNFNNGVCTKTCTYTATGLPSHCKEAPNCKLGSASGEKTYYDTTCTICEDGYEVDAATRLCKQKVYATGDIYYYNGSPIGVVFYSDESVIKIVALYNAAFDGTEVKTNEDKFDYDVLTWADVTGATWDGSKWLTAAYNKGNIWNDNAYLSLQLEHDGKVNTKKILDSIKADNQTAPAATAASLYAPSVCPAGSLCGQGEWYLPAIGELFHIIKYDVSLIETALARVGGLNFQNIAAFCKYWASTEYDIDEAYLVDRFSPTRLATYKYERGKVRPVLAIPRK